MLGILPWFPVILSFLAPLFNLLYSLQDAPPDATCAMTPAATDLALEGLHMLTFSSNQRLKPTPMPMDCVTTSLAAHPPASVATPQACQIFVDYAGVSNTAAYLLVTPQGDCYGAQWRISGMKAWWRVCDKQQLGELAGLCGAVFVGACTGVRTLVFGDNSGALMTLLGQHSAPNVRGRSYWLRRLARALYSASDARSVEIGHAPGFCMPADWLTRLPTCDTDPLDFPVPTWLCRVPVLH